MPPPFGHPPYNNGKGGRPVKYTTEFIEQEADVLDNWIKKQGNIFLEDFCLERGYDDHRCHEWSRINDKFSAALYRFKMRQRSAIFKGGLTKKMGHPMCALVLSHGHGIVAKTEQKITTDVSHPLAFAMEGEGETKELVSG